MLPGCNELSAISHCERLRNACSSALAKSVDKSVQVTASFGVTVVGPGCRVDAEAAIDSADSALYAAKRKGRNRVEFIPATAARLEKVR